MAHAHHRMRWDHTAELLAMIANTIPGRSSPFTADDFHPMRQEAVRARLEVPDALSYLESVGL